ncbi:MAG: DUF5615 family PIN-like protein [Cyanobacteria bacterium J06606_4]
MLKYLIDENLPPLYAEQLRKQRPDIVVRAIGEPGVPSKGTLDPDILDWCELNQFVLFTNNRASMPVHLKDHIEKGRHIPGILTLNPRMTIGETVAELITVAASAFNDEFQDRIDFLPVSK